MALLRFPKRQHSSCGKTMIQGSRGVIIRAGLHETYEVRAIIFAAPGAYFVRPFFGFGLRSSDRSPRRYEPICTENYLTPLERSALTLLIDPLSSM